MQNNSHIVDDEFDRSLKRSTAENSVVGNTDGYFRSNASEQKCLYFSWNAFFCLQNTAGRTLDIITTKHTFLKISKDFDLKLFKNVVA